MCVLLGGKRVSVIWVECEIEVASEEDPGCGVDQDGVLKGVEEGDGVGCGEVGVEMDVDDREVLGEVESAWDDLGMGARGEEFVEKGSVHEDETASSVGGERIKGQQES